MAEIPGNGDWDERLQDWLDGDLGPGEAAAVATHIASCTACQTRASALQAIDTALAEAFSQPRLTASFDRHVLERVATTRQADQAAARARAEREWQEQKATLAHQWHSAWRSTLLNTLAGVALLICVLTTFGALPVFSHLTDRVAPLTQYVSARPVMTLPVAAVMTVVAIWVVRVLARGER